MIFIVSTELGVHAGDTSNVIDGVHWLTMMVLHKSTLFILPCDVRFPRTPMTLHHQMLRTTLCVKKLFSERYKNRSCLEHSRTIMKSIFKLRQVHGFQLNINFLSHEHQGTSRFNWWHVGHKKWWRWNKLQWFMFRNQFCAVSVQSRFPCGFTPPPPFLVGFAKSYTYRSFVVTLVTAVRLAYLPIERHMLSYLRPLFTKVLGLLS